jgi:hypothetical protein
LFSPAENKDIKEYSSVREEDKSGPSESGSVLQKEEQESSYNDNSLHSLESILLPASKLKLILKYENHNRRENLNLDNRSDEKTEFICNNEVKTILSKEVRTIFILKDGSVHGLQDILSIVENRAITVKRMFRGKPINILVDTGCDIIYISSRITL